MVDPPACHYDAQRQPHLLDSARRHLPADGYLHVAGQAGAHAKAPECMSG